eukprot:1619026-Rhodomonas_salina.2
MTLEISDLVSYDWGRCRFISSPSKSALYGEVTERLSRNVEYGMIFTRCPIIDILCSDGCRLKITQSSGTARNRRQPKTYPECKDETASRNRHKRREKQT